MATAAPFQRGAAGPKGKDMGGRAAGDAAHHLEALGGLVKSPRARAALNTLKMELLGEGGTRSSSGKPNGSAAKSAALERFSK